MSDFSPEFKTLGKEALGLSMSFHNLEHLRAIGPPLQTKRYQVRILVAFDRRQISLSIDGLTSTRTCGSPCSWM